MIAHPGSLPACGQGRGSVAIIIRFIGSVDRHIDIFGLFPGQLGEIGADLSEVPLVILQNFSRAEWLQSTCIWDTVQGA